MIKLIIIILPLLKVINKIKEKEKESVKKMESRNISRSIRENVSPFVYMEIFKRVTKKVQDYAFIHLEDSGEESGRETLVCVDDPKKMRFFARTCGMGKNTDQDLILLKMDDGWYLVSKGEINTESVTEPTGDQPSIPNIFDEMT